MPLVALGCLASAGIGAVGGYMLNSATNAQQVRVEDIDTKTEITKFLKKACSSKKTPEYKELYRFLLGIFKKCDRDFDGLVGPDDFDVMVEMAGSIPRMFAFAPSSAESFAKDAERIDFRTKLFKQIDSDGSGKISFDEWLGYCYDHICEKTKSLDIKTVDPPINTKEKFKNFVIKAASSKRTTEYKDLYLLLLKEFVSADYDMDGKISVAEFDEIIGRAADYPRKFGFAPPASVTYKSSKERLAARSKMFSEMDTDGNGTISFEEWLTFTYKHICEKAKTLDQSLTGVPPPFVAGPKGACPFGFDKK
jgi:Ca2+-binding EF-hand superfamily protein